MSWIQNKIKEAKKSFRTAQTENRADKVALGLAKKKSRAEFRKQLVKEKVKVGKQKATYKAQAPQRRAKARQQMVQNFKKGIKERQKANSKKSNTEERYNPYNVKPANNPWK